MPEYTVSLLADALSDCKNQFEEHPLEFWEFHIKRGVGDMRNSPALQIREILETKEP